jgi:hypothetical protein
MSSSGAEDKLLKLIVKSETLVGPAVQNRYLRARMDSTQLKEEWNIKLCWFAGQVLFVWGMLGTDRQQCGT